MTRNLTQRTTQSFKIEANAMASEYEEPWKLPWMELPYLISTRGRAPSLRPRVDLSSPPIEMLDLQPS